MAGLQVVDLTSNLLPRFNVESQENRATSTIADAPVCHNISILYALRVTLSALCAKICAFIGICHRINLLPVPGADEALG